MHTDDEVRISQVPERSEGKTKAISNSTYRLRYWNSKILPVFGWMPIMLQQHLPPAVLKPKCRDESQFSCDSGCNNTYRLRYWNSNASFNNLCVIVCCNNTYRLRYVPKGARRQRSKATMRHIHCLPERREGKTKVIRQQYLPFTVLKRIPYL